MRHRSNSLETRRYTALGRVYVERRGIQWRVVDTEPLAMEAVVVRFVPASIVVSFAELLSCELDDEFVDSEVLEPFENMFEDGPIYDFSHRL